MTSSGTFRIASRARCHGVSVASRGGRSLAGSSPSPSGSQAATEDFRGVSVSSRCAARSCYSRRNGAGDHREARRVPPARALRRRRRPDRLRAQLGAGWVTVPVSVSRWRRSATGSESYRLVAPTRRVAGSTRAPGDARRGAVGYAPANTAAQSSFTLTTVRPLGAGALERRLRALHVGELAVGVVVEDEQAQRRPVLLPPAKRSIGTSPFEFPPATIGRRPIRLQIRTGFTGPSSNTSGCAR